jgi:hypothetical protein
VCLGQGSVPEPTFTSCGLEHFVQAQHSLGIFFRDPMRAPHFLILIQYVLFWIEYNLKYHKGKINSKLSSSQKDKAFEL